MEQMTIFINNKQTKTLSKLGIKGNFFNLIKNTY